MLTKQVQCTGERLMRPGISAVTLAIIALAVAASPAWAQLTTQGLIGSAVTKVGPRFSDVDEAIQRFGNKDYVGAREFLEMAKEKNPELPPTDVTLARMFFTAKDAVSGRRALEKVAKELPEDPEPALIFAEQALSQGRLTDATLLYQAAIGLNKAYDHNQKRKRNMEIRCHRGTAQIAAARQDWPKAKQLIEGWLAIDPDNIAVLRSLAGAQFKMDDARDAYKTFTKIAELDENVDSADLPIAQLYHQKDDQENAQRFFDRALSAASDSATTRLAYARWLMDGGDFVKAKSHVDAALKSKPDSVTALLWAGVVARMENRPADAEKHLAKAHLLAPREAEPINQLALLLVEQSDDKQKARALQFAILRSKLFPDDVNAVATMAWVLHRSDRKAQSQSVIDEALKKNLRGAGRDSNYFAAQLLYDRGKSQTAARVVQAALDARGVFLHRKDAQALADKIAAEQN